MSELQAELQAAFEDRGYEVAEASINRGLVRVALLDEDAEADELRSVVSETVGDENVLGLNVTTERDEGRAATVTVVSFRRRS